MPTTGWLEWYDPTRGFGVIVTATHERFAFDHGSGTEVPAPGAPIVITWKRSRTGHWNVPATVVPWGWVPPPAARSFHLQEWLRGFDAVTGKLRGLTAGMLKRAHGEDLDPWPKKGSARSAWLVLSAIEQSIPGHDAWIRVFDYKEIDDGWLSLPPMVGVRADEIRPQSDRWIGDYFLAACNDRSRTGERLYSLVTESDCYCMIALRPDHCEALVRDGLLAVDQERR